ncbi:MAG: toxin-antitoxin system HicB family antitoxin [Spirochaetales bacterium]|nr:toxin-antitoxin system HicB family antitoxin [Spirochaetales bacterium]
MKAKTNVLTLRIPQDLKDRIEKMADQQGVSINQLAMYAFAREITEMETRGYFQRIYGTKSGKQLRAGFERVMSKVKSDRVPNWDKPVEQ